MKQTDTSANTSTYEALARMNKVASLLYVLGRCGIDTESIRQLTDEQWERACDAADIKSASATTRQQVIDFITRIERGTE